MTDTTNKKFKCMNSIKTVLVYKNVLLTFNSKDKQYLGILLLFLCEKGADVTQFEE